MAIEGIGQNNICRFASRVISKCDEHMTKWCAKSVKFINKSNHHVRWPPGGNTFAGLYDAYYVVFSVTLDGV